MSRGFVPRFSQCQGFARKATSRARGWCSLGFSVSASDYYILGYTMFSQNVKLLCFLLMLQSFLRNPSAQRSPVDVNLRGNSFGLENFLFQSYENTENKDTVHTVKSKRIRPPPNSRIIINERSQTYGLENLQAQMYESSRLKPATAKPIQDFTKRRPIEPIAESNKINENLVGKSETVFDVTPESEVSTQEITTERIRKRIMMRRRRKRPSNASQPEDNSEITGNAIIKPTRISVYPQTPQLTIKTKLPDEEAVNRLQSMGVKTIRVPQTVSNIPEEIIEEQITTVTEQSIIPTTKHAKASEKPSTINLKTFLKQQTETLSLSELLQTQNLSLADLLRGNKDASVILKARQPITSTTATITTTNVRRKQFNRIGMNKTEPPPKNTEVIEVNTSRPSYNGFQPKIPRTKVGEQFNSKPIEENPDEIVKQIKRPTFTSSPAGSDPRNRLNELRMKLRNFQKKPNLMVTQLEITSEPPEKSETVEPVFVANKTTELPSYKKNRVSFKSANNPELPLILPNKIKPEPDDIKRPERLTNWTSRLPSIKRIAQDRLKSSEIPMKPFRIPISVDDGSKSSKNDEEPTTTPKIDETTEEQNRKPEPKDELIELLKSGQNADRLQKILNSRNMTIQELLDNREKPPLQMNISSLFSKHQKEISTTTQPRLFDSLSDIKIEETDSPDIAYDEPEAEESAPNIARVLLVPSREPKQFEFPMSEKGVSQLNLQSDDLTSGPFNTEDSALWKLSEKSIYYGSSYGYGDFPAIQQTEKPKSVRTTELTDSDIILLETIRRDQETNRKFKLDLNDFVRQEEEPQTEDIEKSYIPPAVKSAILASGVVMGIALFVFIAIFAACGWKQRQIRLKSSSSNLGGTSNKREKTKRTLSPVSFKDSHSYKKTVDFGDETSESGTSNTSSYLWSTLKNTFTSRASTLKSRLEKEEKLREDKVTLRRNESRRKENRSDDSPISMKKIDRDRNVINTSFNFKRSSSNNNVSHFNECVHGY